MFRHLEFLIWMLSLPILDAFEAWILSKARQKPRDDDGGWLTGLLQFAFYLIVAYLLY